jgi:hypothetical protein
MHTRWRCLTLTLNLRPCRPNLLFWQSRRSTPIRYVGDAKDFWRHIVTSSVGTDNEALFEEVFSYYKRREAWVVAEGAVEAIERLRRRGGCLRWWCRRGRVGLVGGGIFGEVVGPKGEE